MSVARVTEISAMSSTGFEDAVQQAIARASQTLRGVSSAWVKEQRVQVENGQISQYQVNVMITFVLEDGDAPA
ncbi:MAG: dodecin family protein [Actinobacteria bacterium]|nr:dodecin family protein [Actinomycetota bacterium]